MRDIFAQMATWVFTLIKYLLTCINHLWMLFVVLLEKVKTWIPQLTVNSKCTKKTSELLYYYIVL